MPQWQQYNQEQSEGTTEMLCTHMWWNSNAQKCTYCCPGSLSRNYTHGKRYKPAAYLGFRKGGAWRARRERAYNRGLGAEPPAGPPWSWSTAFERSMEAAKFAHFFLKFGNTENHSVISDAISHGDFNRILYRYEKRQSNIVEFCNSCWKTAKNAPFHIKSP